MKSGFKQALTAVATALLLVACAQEGSPSPSVAVLDLAAVAKATGQDEVIREQADIARAELTAQLQQLAANLEQQLAAEREKAGTTPSEGDAQRLQEMTAQARREVGDAQQQAQQQANLIESNLVTDFRDKVEPLASAIAAERGVSAVMAADAYLFWFDPAIDITDEVIAAWRALPAEKSASAQQTELEADGEELAVVESEIAVVEEEIQAAEETAPE